MLDLPDVEGMEVACDTESSGLYVDDYARGSSYRCSLAVVSLAWMDERSGAIQALALPFDQERYNDKQHNGDRPTLWEGEDGGSDPNLGEEEWRELLDWLSRRRLIGQKIKHDLHFLRSGTRHWSGVDLDRAVGWDTLLASRLLEPTESAALDAIGKRHFGQGKSDQELNEIIARSRGRYGTPKHPRLDLVPWSVMRGYAAQDAALTLRVKLWQAEQFQRRPRLFEQFQQELALLPILYRMERSGVEYDRQAADWSVSACLRRMETVEVDLEFAPTPDDAAGWFFDKMKAKPHCKTEVRGRPSVKECCVRSLLDSEDGTVSEQAELYQRWVKLSSAIAKYYRGWTDQLGADGRLRTDFDQSGTVSNRFSSKRVNLQAVPNEYRHQDALGGIQGAVLPRYLLFPEEQMAAQGLVVREFDLGQAELRMATAYAGCRAMRKMLEEGADVHSETAKRLFGKVTKEHRQVAKRANFALIYDVGTATFRDDIEKQVGLVLTFERAKEIRDGWRAIYPEFHDVNGRAELLAKQRKWVQLWDGRKRWFSAFELQYESYKAFNQVIQGGIAQIVKAWMVEVDRRYQGVLRLQVHDSLVCALPVDRADAWSAGIIRVGRRIATRAAGIEMDVESKPWREGG